MTDDHGAITERDTSADETTITSRRLLQPLRRDPRPSKLHVVQRDQTPIPATAAARAVHHGLLRAKRTLLD